METQFEKLATAALELSPGERAAFAQLLLDSLQSDSDVKEAWLVEAERRAAELDRGEVHAMPVADALAQLRALLK